MINFDESNAIITDNEKGFSFAFSIMGLKYSQPLLLCKKACFDISFVEIIFVDVLNDEILYDSTNRRSNATSRSKPHSSI